MLATRAKGRRLLDAGVPQPCYALYGQELDSDPSCHLHFLHTLDAIAQAEITSIWFLCQLQIEVNLLKLTVQVANQVL